MTDASFIYTNFASTPPTVPADGAAFSIDAPPKSDIYVSPHKPIPFYDYTGPTITRRMRKEQFVSVQATASARWRKQFDQAGLVFALPTKNNPNPDAQNSRKADTHPCWIKAGIEVNNGHLTVSCVARAPGGWADWSLVPQFGKPLDAVAAVTLKFDRHDNALMVWLVHDDADAATGIKEEERVLIRKLPWVFLDDISSALGDDVLVGVYAAQPDPDNISQGKSLEVTVSGFKIETV